MIAKASFLVLFVGVGFKRKLKNILLTFQYIKSSNIGILVKKSTVEGLFYVSLPDQRLWKHNTVLAFQSTHLIESPMICTKYLRTIGSS